MIGQTAGDSSPRGHRAPDIRCTVRCTMSAQCAASPSSVHAGRQGRVAHSLPSLLRHSLQQFWAPQ